MDKHGLAAWAFVFSLIALVLSTFAFVVSFAVAVGTSGV